MVRKRFCGVSFALTAVFFLFFSGCEFSSVPDQDDFPVSLANPDHGPLQSKLLLDANILSSRTSGKAPLAVFFDATATEGLPDGDYVDANFVWNFGDPNSGTWSSTGKSKNSATGFIASHVYEAPGVYTVNLSVTDKAGRTASTTATITVAPFSGTTYYLSSVSGSDSNDGRFSESDGYGHGPWKNLRKINQSAGDDSDETFLSDSYMRILLKRGETFVANSVDMIKFKEVNPSGGLQKGPVIIGAYGQGSKPVIYQTAANEPGIFLWSDCHNIVLMDIDFRGSYVWAGPNPNPQHMGILTGDNISNFLLLRVDIHNFYYGVLFEGSGNSDEHIVDCHLYNNNLIHFGSNEGNMISLLGNVIENTYISHNVYAYFDQKFYAANNRFSKPGWNNTGGIPKPNDGKFYTNRSNLRLAINANAKDVVITDNRCSEGHTKIQVGLMDSTSIGVQIDNVLIERNNTENKINAFWDATSIFLDAVNRCVVRNNVILHGPEGLSNSAIATDIYSSGDSRCASSKNIKIYNNSYFSHYAVNKESDNRFLMVKKQGSENFAVYNNIASITTSRESNPDVCVFELPDKFAGSKLISDFNLWYLPQNPLFTRTSSNIYTLGSWQKLTGNDVSVPHRDPLFVNPQNGDLHLDADSPAINSGIDTPVYEDHDRNSRPLKGLDLGAYENSQAIPSPKANFKVTPLIGSAPLNVAFDASLSLPSNNASIISYQWDFENNGSFDAGGVNANHTYVAVTNPDYIAKLMITDSMGKTAVSVKPIMVNCPSTIIGRIKLLDYYGDPSEKNIIAEMQDNDAGVIVARTINIDSDGNYVLPGNAAGTYKIGFKADHWLKAVFANAVVNGDTILDEISLINGDCDYDNEIFFTDISYVLKAFGSKPGDPNWYAGADLAGVNEVTINSLNIVVSNFGNVGNNFEDYFNTLCTLIGKLYLQNYVGDITKIDIAVELRKHGAGVFLRTIRLDDQGNFIIPHVQPGTYDIAFKASHWLRKTFRGMEIVSNTVLNDTFTLINGDCDGNNYVDQDDLDILFAAWGNSPGGTNWDERANLYGDNEIFFTNLSVLLASWHLAGDE